VCEVSGAGSDCALFTADATDCADTAAPDPMDMISRHGMNFIIRMGLLLTPECENDVTFGSRRL
jgi:hypothetical protein